MLNKDKPLKLYGNWIEIELNTNREDTQALLLLKDTNGYQTKIHITSNDIRDLINKLVHCANYLDAKKEFQEARECISNVFDLKEKEDA